ncbi:MAG: ADP-ribosylation factor-like protein [Microcoleaceae cyanobacterium]
MVLPFIIGGAAISGAAIITYQQWQEIIRFLYGQKISILGGRQTGKTTLHTYLSEGRLIKEYEQTVTNTKMPRVNLKIDDLKIRIREGYDVGGGKPDRDTWRILFRESDIVFYLFRADHLDQEYCDSSETRKCDCSKTKERIPSDLDRIVQWIEEIKKEKSSQYKNPLIKKQSSKKILFVGTHCDHINDYEKKIDILKYNDLVRRMTGIARSQNDEIITVVALGSLRSKLEADNLVKNIFSSILKK